MKCELLFLIAFTIILIQIGKFSYILENPGIRDINYILKNVFLRSKLLFLNFIFKIKKS